MMLIDYIPSFIIVVCFCVMSISFLIFSYSKIIDWWTDENNKKTNLIWFIAYFITIFVTFILGVKYSREDCLNKIAEANNKLEKVMLETKSTNLDIIEKENEKVIAREEQKVKIITQIKEVKSDEFKDYYFILNNASRNPNK